MSKKLPPPPPYLTEEQERQLVRSAYENFPEAALCFRCDAWSYGDKPGKPFRFVFVDVEEGGKRHVITEDDAVRGLRVFARLMSEGRLPGLGLPANYLSPEDDFSALGDWDGFAFDALAQCAMFGDVIYG